MKALKVLAALGVSLGASVALGDTVFLKNGSKIHGRIADEGPEGVRLLFEGGGAMRIDASLVAATARDDRTASVRREAPAEPVPAALREERPAPAAERRRPLTERERAIVEGIRASTLFPEIDPELRGEIERNIYDLARWRTRNRVRAERKLVAIGREAVPWVIAMARHPFELTRRAALRILSAAADPRAIPVALTGLRDDDRFVRDSALQLLRSLTGLHLGEGAESWETYFRELMARADSAP